MQAHTIMSHNTLNHKLLPKSIHFERLFKVTLYYSLIVEVLLDDMRWLREF